MKHFSNANYIFPERKNEVDDFINIIIETKHEIQSTITIKNTIIMLILAPIIYATIIIGMSI